MKRARYCSACGAYIPEGQKKCLACKAPIETIKYDADIIPTTTLEDNTFVTYVTPESVLDLDKSECRVKFQGDVWDAMIMRRILWEAGRDAGRSIDGRINRGYTLNLELGLMRKD